MQTRHSRQMQINRICVVQKATVAAVKQNKNKQSSKLTRTEGSTKTMTNPRARTRKRTHNQNWPTGTGLDLCLMRLVVKYIKRNIFTEVKLIFKNMVLT